MTECMFLSLSSHETFRPRIQSRYSLWCRGYDCPEAMHKITNMQGTGGAALDPLGSATLYSSVQGSSGLIEEILLRCTFLSCLNVELESLWGLATITLVACEHFWLVCTVFFQFDINVESWSSLHAWTSLSQPCIFQSKDESNSSHESKVITWFW